MHMVRKLFRTSTGLAIMFLWVAAASPANAATDLSCSGASHSLRVSVTGGCAWGNVSLNGVDGHTHVDMVVVDNKNDNLCAVFFSRTIYAGIPGKEKNRGSACGYGNSKPIQYDAGKFPWGTGDEYRVCVGSSCSAWEFPS